MSRWYCPQACHWKKGWIDLPSLASKKQHEAERNLAAFLKSYSTEHVRQLFGGSSPVGRTIRKPHGWKPAIKGDIPGDMHTALSRAQSTESVNESTGHETGHDVHKIVYFSSGGRNSPINEPVGLCIQGEWPRDLFAFRWADVTCGFCIVGRRAGGVEDLPIPSYQKPIIGNVVS